MSELYGIDISHWNGNIDFSKINKSFVIMKVSQGTHKDVKFDEYFSKCNLPKGVYIYNKVKNIAEAKAEAEFAVKCLKGKHLEYGVWLDMEDSSMRKLGKKMLTDIINTEAYILTMAGFKVGIYCNRDWYKNVLDSAMLSNTYPFWIARYPLYDNGTVHENLSPKDLKGCAIWQYSSKGKVNGMGGNVDLNIQFKPPFALTNSVSGIISAPTADDIDRLAHDVIDGLYGSGEIRKQRLGDKYSVVQARVNEILKGR